MKLIFTIEKDELVNNNSSFSYDHRYNFDGKLVHFGVMKTKKSITIITEDVISEAEKKMLENFFSPFKNTFNKVNIYSWYGFYTAVRAIAFTEEGKTTFYQYLIN